MPVPLIELSVFTSPEAQRCYDNYVHGSRHDDDIVMMARISVGLRSQDLAVMIASAKATRRILSRTPDPPTSMMINAGVIRPLVEALDRNDCYDLQFEAAWALTNIASGTHEHTMAVVDCGAIPKLVSLVPRGGNIGEQSAWVLSNIAGDGTALRDMVLHAGALAALLPLLTVTTPIGHLKTAVWTFSNFCRGKDPVVDFDLVAAALPYISDLLVLQDRYILADACWAISYLSDGPNDHIEGVQATPNLLARLVSLLSHSTAAVQVAALRALGNMLTGSNEETDRCLDTGCLGPLNELLTADKTSLVKDAAWACSNILAGPPQQIQRLIDSGALYKLVAVTQHTNSKCQREAAWAFTNLCCGGTTEQLDALLQSGFLEPYCALLASQEANILLVVLDGLSYLLKAVQKCGQEEALCLILEEIGAVDHIEELNEHEDEQIYKKSSHILDTFFSIQDEGVIIAANYIEDEPQFGFN